MKNKRFLRQALFIYIIALALVTLSFYGQAQTEGSKEVHEKSSETSSSVKEDVKADPSEKKAPPSADPKKEKSIAQKGKRKKDVFAIFETNKGHFKIKLFTEEAPKTVENFIGLAEGTIEATDGTGKKQKKPFYNNTKFHRVISGFMIQGGDPKGDGTGGPGYKIKDEINPNLKHNKPGILSMAKTQEPDSGGSQFFITVAPTPHLDNIHTIFGEVVEGMDVVMAISKVPTTGSPYDRPLQDVIVKTVKIVK